MLPRTMCSRESQPPCGEQPYTEAHVLRKWVVLSPVLWVILETDMLASANSSEDCSPDRQPNCKLLRASEPQPSS